MNEESTKDSNRGSDTQRKSQGSKSPLRTSALILGATVLALYFVTIALHGEFQSDFAFWMVAAGFTVFGVITAAVARSKVLLLFALLVPTAQLILMLLAFVTLIILMFAKAAVNLIAQFFTGEMVWPEPMSF